MPTGTFFRLPEEKRQRLTEAAWDEFTRVPFSEASINRIIHSAHIPRGSFYQYFADKEDLFSYILTDVRDFFMGVLAHILKNSDGNVFATVLQAYDELVFQSEGADIRLRRCGQLLQLNPELGMRNILSGRPDGLPQCVLQSIDTTRFYRTDPGFVESICALLFISLSAALVEVLFDPEQRQASRQALQARADIVRRGAVCAPDGADQNQWIST